MEASGEYIRSKLEMLDTDNYVRWSADDGPTAKVGSTCFGKELLLLMKNRGG